MNADQQALLARFDAFIAKLDERLREIFAEADAGASALMQQRPGELIPVRNALGAIDHLTRQLTAKLDEVWDQQIEGLFRQHGNAFWDLGLDRRDDARASLELAVERFKLAKEGECLRAMYLAVQAAIQRSHPCTSCGGPLRLRIPYEAETIQCPSCGVVNQLMPEPIVSNYFLFGQQVFPAQECLELRAQIDRDRSRVSRDLRAQGYPNESFESLTRWEQQEASYWRRYAEVKAAFLGKPVDEEFIASRTRQFREMSLMTNQVYRRGMGL